MVHINYFVQRERVKWVRVRVCLCTVLFHFVLFCSVASVSHIFFYLSSSSSPAVVFCVWNTRDSLRLYFSRPLSLSVCAILEALLFIARGYIENYCCNFNYLLYGLILVVLPTILLPPNLPAQRRVYVSLSFVYYKLYT